MLFTGRKNAFHLSLIRPFESESGPIFMRPFPLIKERETEVPLFNTMFMSLMPRLSDPETEQFSSIDNKPKPISAVIMAIRRKIEPQIDLPLRPDNHFKPNLPLVLALLRQKLEKSQQEPIPSNPFFGILKKLIKKSIASKERLHFLNGKVPKSEEKVEKPVTNYNFNVNFTINYNNYEKERNPFSENPFPFPFKLL